MKKNIHFPDWEAVGKHYDNKGKDDLNWLVANDKRIVHHHSGLIYDKSLLERNFSEKALLSLLGDSEDQLSLFGGRVLGLKNKKGLDCGCGRGGSSFILARQFGHRMTGITVSDSQLEFATNAARELGLEEQTLFAKRNIYFDEIPGKDFDFIWACESTEYMPDHKRLFSRWHELLKPEGLALVIAITYRESRLPLIEEELQQVDDLYETKIGEFGDYIESAITSGFIVEDFHSLEDPIIPYYQLRLKSEHKRGSEEWLLKGLINGHFKYALMLFRKK